MAPQTKKLEVVQEIQCSPDDLYRLCTRDAPQLPKYVPELIISVEVTGEGEVCLGTVFVWTAIVGGSVNTSKYMVTAVDNKSRSFTQTAFEGDNMKDFKSFIVNLDVTPKFGATDGTSLVKWSLEYEKANEVVADPVDHLNACEVLTTELNIILLKRQQQVNSLLSLEDLQHIMAPQKLEVVHEVKCSADELYRMCTRDAPQLPKYVPELVKSVELTAVTADGEVRLGTVFVWTVTVGGSVTTIKDTITAVDNKSRSITYTVFDGDVKKDFKSLIVTLDITPKMGTTDGTSVVKWSIEYAKANETVADPVELLNACEVLTTEMNVNLLKQA